MSTEDNTPRRYQLQAMLQELVENVYFQPPNDVQMQYPCIVYTRANDRTRHANNKLYFRKKRYTVTVIDPNPDSGIPDEVAKLPLCKMSSHFTVKNLNHDVFSLYF